MDAALKRSTTYRDIVELVRPAGAHTGWRGALTAAAPTQRVRTLAVGRSWKECAALCAEAEAAAADDGAVARILVLHGVALRAMSADVEPALSLWRRAFAWRPSAFEPRELLAFGAIAAQLDPAVPSANLADRAGAQARICSTDTRLTRSPRRCSAFSARGPSCAASARRGGATR